jgi:hypothetical protein
MSILDKIDASCGFFGKFKTSGPGGKLGYFPHNSSEQQKMFAMVAFDAH